MYELTLRSLHSPCYCERDGLQNSTALVIRGQDHHFLEIQCRRGQLDGLALSSSISRAISMRVLLQGGSSILLLPQFAILTENSLEGTYHLLPFSATAQGPHFPTPAPMNNVQAQSARHHQSCWLAQAVQKGAFPVCTRLPTFSYGCDIISTPNPRNYNSHLCTFLS